MLFRTFAVYITLGVMKHVPLTDVIAERELEFVPDRGSPQKVVVRLGALVRDQDGTWWCPYVIEGSSFRRQFRIAGEDSMQALLLTQKTIVVELDALAREHQGSFTWFGEPDLGLT